jgi:hypothetical protein
MAEEAWPVQCLEGGQAGSLQSGSPPGTGRVTFPLLSAIPGELRAGTATSSLPSKAYPTGNTPGVFETEVCLRRPRLGSLCLPNVGPRQSLR